MRAAIVIVVTIGAFAQSFEVASIKPAPPQAPGRVSTRMSSVPGRLSYTNVSLSDLIGQAYRVQHMQIQGPDWLNAERFDIAAKLPEGVGRNKLPEMFQNLLADRFGLELHRETKELPVYRLVAARKGPKLKKAGAARGSRGSVGKGQAHFSSTITMPQFADSLAPRVGRLVLDKTGLDGVYAITLDWTPDAIEEPAAVAGPSIFTALQQQLGLKLVAGKGPVEVLVIDHLEKVPTEN